MDFETLKFLLWVSLPVIFGSLGWVIKNLHTRLDRLDNEIREKVTEQDVRTILSDKLDPLHEDLKDIKKQIERLTDYILKKDHE